MTKTQVIRPNKVSPTLSYYLESYGCQMNEYDSAIAQHFLEKTGAENNDNPEEADIILLNTCAIREKAHEKIYHRLESFAYLKKKKRKPIIGILGCMAQALGDDLLVAGLPVDFILGPDNYRELEGIALKYKNWQGFSNITQLSRTETYEDVYATQLYNSLGAFVTIMRGCDNFCSFCVVPYTRGRERSLNPEAIASEIQNLIQEKNIKEVTLLGQNVNSYSYEGEDFTSLIQKILHETTIERIRFTSPHPKDFPNSLLDLMKREKRFCSQIHLPLQSGSDNVLERMKRDYTAATFRSLVNKIRDKVGQEVLLSTDVIVGFCGETEKEFEETLQMMQEIQFDMAYMFKYSERKNTYASKNMQDSVPEHIKKERLEHLIGIQNKIASAKNKKFLGLKVSILVESYSKRSKEELSGRMDNGKTVIFKPKSKEDKLPHSMPTNLLENYHKKVIDIEITHCTSATLRGQEV